MRWRDKYGIKTALKKYQAPSTAPNSRPQEMEIPPGTLIQNAKNRRDESSSGTINPMDFDTEPNLGLTLGF